MKLNVTLQSGKKVFKDKETKEMKAYWATTIKLSVSSIEIAVKGNFYQDKESNNWYLYVNKLNGFVSVDLREMAAQVHTQQLEADSELKKYKAEFELAVE